ncbi:MAG: squalene synthase HpnC [Betaproteobacteria bacterium]|nr:squalene synthase HpnC [Betaproteobacteria bacterium]NBY04777.1 squalene synthase HpnC [Betaproteobacteria bacterium]
MAWNMRSVDHYENFPVASWLCPPHLRGAVIAIYHFARTADDLADEGDDSPDQRLKQLAAYRLALQRACPLPNGAIHPAAAKDETDWPEVFVPLAQYIQSHALPLACLHALLDAFEQDVIFTRDDRRYANRDELLAYCERSANPVGRLLLHLYGVQDAKSLQWSDAVCTSLQLINFWQDLSVDLTRGRHYLPQGSDLPAEVAFARTLMNQGAALVHRLPGRAAWELRLVVQGGLRIIDKIERGNPWQQRPKLVPSDWAVMLWRACRMRQR